MISIEIAVPMTPLTHNKYHVDNYMIIAIFNQFISRFIFCRVFPQSEGAHRLSLSSASLALRASEMQS